MAETLPGIKGNKNYSVGKGCPTNDPAATLALASNDKANNLAAIAKNVGMTQKCQKQAKTHSDQFMTDTKAALVTWVAAAAVANTTTNNLLDHEMHQSGCGAFSLTANTMMNETNNITCNINSTYSSQTQTAKVGASINFKTVRPSPDAIKTINDTVSKNSAILAKSSTQANMPQPPSPSANPEILKVQMEMFETQMDIKKVALKLMGDANTLYIKQNPTSAGVFDSNINLVLKQDIKMSSSQNVNDTVHTQIQESVKNIAAAVAFNKISQVTGVDSLSSNSKQFLQNKITDAVNNQTDNIKSQISQNTMSLNTDGSINMTYSGPVHHDTINANLSSQASMQINQVITSAVTIGQQVASEITNQIASTNESDSKDAGLADMIKAAGDSLTKQINAADSGQNKFFKGFFDFFGNIWLIMAAVGIAVLMFFPQLTKVFPPSIRFVLMGLLALVIVFWWFGIWPMGKTKGKKEKYDPSNTVFDPNNTVLNVLFKKDGKNIGWRRTYSARRENFPYQFKSGGNWILK